MAYSSGMMNIRVAIMVRDTVTEGDFGRNSAGRSYKYGTTVWAAKDFNRGLKAMHEGALDAYDRVMFRMYWNPTIDRYSMLVYDGKTYQIESFNANRQKNIIQITAVEAPGKDLTGLLPGPTPSEPLTPDDSNNSDDTDAPEYNETDTNNNNENETNNGTASSHPE